MELIKLNVILEFFEYQIVAVVDNEAHINTARELKGSKFCHPGHQIQNHWTEVLADVGNLVGI